MELDEDPAIEPDPLVDWRMPYLDYLLRDVLPTDKTEARALPRRALQMKPHRDPTVLHPHRTWEVFAK